MHGVEGRITRVGPIQRSKAAVFGLQILNALARLHCGLRAIHGGIKPGNLCEDDNGLAWLIDFGVAAWLKEGEEVAGDCLGRAKELPAPEAADHDALTRKAGVYSAGEALKHWISILDEEKRWKSPRDVTARQSLLSLASKMTESRCEARVTSSEALKNWASARSVSQRAGALQRGCLFPEFAPGGHPGCSLDIHLAGYAWPTSLDAAVDSLARNDANNISWARSS